VKRFPLPAAVVVGALALLGLLVYGVAAKQDNRTIDDALRGGHRIAAPSRSLPVLGASAQRSLASYRGRVVVLNFWASWCVPCRREVGVLEAEQRRIAPRKATVLGVNFRDTIPDATAFAKEFRIAYPSLRDVEGKLAKDYGTVALPETFVIDRRGRIAAARRGEVDAAFLKRAVTPLLAEASS
jgi:cytochrome c biogenesis protein CcmG/thiol:disulfide interchange protein DsbE